MAKTTRVVVTYTRQTQIEPYTHGLRIEKTVELAIEEGDNPGELRAQVLEKLVNEVDGEMLALVKRAGAYKDNVIEAVAELRGAA